MSVSLCVKDDRPLSMTSVETPVTEDDIAITKKLQPRADCAARSEDRLIIINIGGTRFTTLHSTLTTIPNTKLTQLVELDKQKRRDNAVVTNEFQSKILQANEYYFDRNAEMFSSILDFCRHGELHLPKHLCGDAIKLELYFWNVPLYFISDCCERTVSESDRAKKRKAKMERLFSRTGPCIPRPKQEDSWFAKAQYKAWYYIEISPFESKSALMFLFLYLLFTIATIAVLILETNMAFREPLNYTFNATENTDMSNPKIRNFLTTKIASSLWMIDMTCLVYFTIEMLFRFIMYPCKFTFIKHVFNIIDLLCVLMAWTKFSLETIYNIPQGLDGELGSVVNIYNVFNISKIMRIWRLIGVAYQYSFVRILILSIIESWRILLMMVFVIVIGVLIYAPLVYLAEFDSNSTFLDIPIGCWWAIVTMTTVGYGDVVPVTIGGYIVGSLCAVSGIILTALPIAVIGNNFNNLYSYAIENGLTITRLKCDETDKNIKIREEIKMSVKKRYSANSATHGYNLNIATGVSSFDVEKYEI